jgi:hypothetical protein
VPGELAVGARGHNKTKGGTKGRGKPERCRILTLDGGGIRGIVSAVWLKHLEKKANGEVREQFALVAGPSTAGILAAAVGPAPYPHLWVTLPDAEGVKQLSPGSAPRRRRKRHPG